MLSLNIAKSKQIFCHIYEPCNLNVNKLMFVFSVLQNVPKPFKLTSVLRILKTIATAIQSIAILIM